VTGFLNRRLAEALSLDFSDERLRFAFSSSLELCYDSRLIVKFPDRDGRLLQLEGRMLDTISNFSNLQMWGRKRLEPFHNLKFLIALERHSRHILETLQGWALKARRTPLYVNGQSWQGAFISTISGVSMISVETTSA
jgi:hypothetical protein